MLVMALLVDLPGTAVAYSPNPDLTAAGAIAALKSDPNAYPPYSSTYNLGATGLRGWIYIGGGSGADGLQTSQSRQILVTVASAPGSAALAVDDVILGAMAASSGTVPLFADSGSDCRKAFGAALTAAERTGGGSLRVKRWRAGATTDVNIPVTILGDYTATAPYACPKSTLILANARTDLVGRLLADPNFLTSNWSGAISGLALLAGVAPGDPDYAAVQSRLQTFARALAASPPGTSDFMTLDIWGTSYIALFLSEYYLSTNDAQVIAGVNSYTLALAKAQSRYGTYGHGGSLVKADGSLHGTIPPYGPVNQCGITANIAIVMGKKALVAAGQAIDAEINPAIQRGSDFFGWFVNKGSIPYGEHEPWYNHGSNGKDAQCAVLFGLQTNRLTEAEYFSRMSIAGYPGREYGHTGQGFSYLWGAMGANMGGTNAVATYLEKVRWHLDLERRTDGSFVYDGDEQFGAGTTADGTYLGASSYNGMDSTAVYILTYSLPLQRLHITGKSANPANTLNTTKVANAIAAATYSLDCTNTANYPVSRLITDLGEFDPLVRNDCAIELAKRSLSAGELTTLRGMLTDANANLRMGACQTLGLLQDATALPLIVQRLDRTVESNSWVRAKAAAAIRSYPPATASAYCVAMLAAYAANATDPEVIVWDDPVQISNNYLSFALFGDAVYGGNNIASTTINAPKNLLYPAVKAGLKQPDSNSRCGVTSFCYDRLTLADVQSLALDIFEVITRKSQADTMWSAQPQLKGIALLKKHNCAEGLPMALSMMDVKAGWGHGSAAYLSEVLDNLATWGDSARWIIPLLNEDISTLQPILNIVDYTPTVPKIQSTIATIDSAITSPSGVTNLLPLATSQVVATTGATSIRLAGTSPRSAVTFTNVTAPAHGTLTGTPPDLTYTPAGGYTGPDHFTFQVTDSLTTSAPGTVSILVGTAGTGLKGEYFDNMDFTSLKLTRTDAQVAFDWGAGSPDASIGADTFSVRWSGVLLVPETGTYTFSTLNSDGLRLYVNGTPVIDDFTNQETGWVDGTSVSLTAGQWVELQMDYYENTGSSVAKLKWTGPSFAGLNGAIIGTEWLFDGTGMPRTPYAFPQSLTLLMNKSRAITLTATAGAVSYSVVTPPAHGTLTGTAPNLTYTPSANYIGLDSFTFKVNNGTTDSTPATVSLDVIPGNIFSVNFFAYGGLPVEAQTNVLLGSSVSAGLADWFTYGWTNIEVPWGLDEPQAPRTLYSNQRSTANFIFKDCRNGGPYDGSVPRTTLLGDGNGNLMDGHVNSTLDPFDASALFDMEVTAIPFAVYDVIFYMGANKDQYGDGTGVITFNGGADRAFTLKPGAFDGTFTEMVNSSTPGNYIIFHGVTGSVFTAKTWGTGTVGSQPGFVHIGPCGFQIREVVIDGDTTTTIAASPGGTASYSDAVTFTATASYSGTPMTGTVVFKEGNTVLASRTLDANGQARYVTSTLAVGNRSITATYEGNGGYPGSASSPISYVVTPKPLTISGVTAANKIYDGTTGAALTGGSLSAGVVSGETVSVVPGSGTFASKNVGTWAVTAAGYALGGDHAANYVLAAQPIVANASITPRPVYFSGTRTYDGTTALAASSLSITNKVGSEDVSLTGSATLSSKNVGVQTVSGDTVYSTPTRIQSATGNTGSSASTSFVVTLAGTPSNGNTLVAVISTRGTAINQVTGITQTGATWSRASQAANANGTTTEIWHAPNVSGAGTAITINQASLRSAAVVTEYSGILTASPLDQTANATGASIAPVTGTTPSTTQANELWIGGIGLSGSAYTLGTVQNGFASITNAQTSSGTATDNAKVYLLESITSAMGAAASGGTVSGVQTAVIAQRGLATSDNGTTSVSPALPTGLAQNDLLIACVVAYGTSVSTPSTLSGWTLIKNAGSLGNSNRRRCAIMYKLAGASESAPSFTITGSVASFATLIAFSGVDLANPLDVAPTSLPAIATGTAADTAVSGGAITSATSNARVIMFGMGVSTATGTGGAKWADAGWSTATSPGALSELYDLQGSGTGNNSTSIGAAWATKATTGDTGAAAATLSSAMRNGGLLLALKPAMVPVQWSGAIATFKAASIPSLVLNGAAAANYTLTGMSGTMTVTAKALTLSGTTVNNKIYDATVAATLANGTLAPPEAAGAGATGDGRPYTDDAVDVTLSGIFETKDAGVNKVVTSTSFLTGDQAGNYTLTQPGDLTATITPKALDVTGAAVASKPYDGTTDATLSAGALRTEEAPGDGSTTDNTPYTGDEVGLSLSGFFVSSNVGTGISVTSTSTLTGAQASNYTLTQPADLTGAITARALTVTANNQSKAFGATLAFGSGSTLFFSSGLQAGETIGSVTLSCDGGASEATLGTYPITPTAATGGSFSPFNYMLAYTAGTLTVLDLQPPTPDPMTFAVAPAALGTDAIVMTATTAVDTLSPPVTYLFENTTNAATSGWVPGSVWTNTSLSIAVPYGFRVKARDALSNETAWSQVALATIPVPQPTVSFAAASGSGAEAATSVSVDVLLSHAYPGTVTVQPQVTGGTATDGQDFITGETITFSPGETNKPFSFTVVNDSAAEADETVVFELGAPVNGVAGVPGTFTYTIEADAADWHTLPFIEPFESRNLGDLDGQYGWSATGTVVQANTTFGGSAKAALVTESTGSMRRTFSDGRTKVWIDLRMKVVQCPAAPVPSEQDTAVVYVSTNGMIMAFNGNMPVSTGFTAAAGEWIRVTICNNYTTATWTLYINGASAGNYGFYSSAVASFSGFLVKGVDTVVDDLAITLDRPPIPPLPTLLLLQ